MILKNINTIQIHELINLNLVHVLANVSFHAINEWWILLLEKLPHFTDNIRGLPYIFIFKIINKIDKRTRDNIFNFIQPSSEVYQKQNSQKNSMLSPKRSINQSSGSNQIRQPNSQKHFIFQQPKAQPPKSCAHWIQLGPTKSRANSIIHVRTRTI